MRVIKNQSPISPSFDLKMQSGSYKDLDDTQTLPIPLASHFTSRASTATYVDDGVVKYAAIDELRVEDGIPLYEEASTNVALHSDNLDTNESFWAKANITQTLGQSSPDGNATASKIVSDVFTNKSSYVRSILKIIDDSVPADTLITQSCFVKKGTLQYCLLATVPRKGTQTQVFFDFDNKEFVKIHADIVSSNIKELNNGWFRLSITYQIGEDIGGNYGGQFRVFLTDNPNSSIFDSDGTDYMYVWGAQIEIGDKVTSYIPTQDTSITRAADVWDMDNTSIVYYDYADHKHKLIASQDIGEKSSDNLETIKNGTFDSADGWTLGEGTTIEGGLAKWNGTQISGSNIEQAGVYQLLPMKIGRMYLLNMDVMEITSGNIKISIYDGAGGGTPFINIPGNHKIIYTAVRNGDMLILRGDLNFAGSVDSFSAKEVLPNSTSYTFTDIAINNIATFDGETLTQADLDLLDAKPELLGKLAFGATDTGLSVSPNSIVSWYPCSESGEKIYDMITYEEETGDERTTDQHLSDISATGTITYSGQHPSYPAWRAFNKDTATEWIGLPNTYTEWIKYEFVKSNILQSFRYSCPNGNVYWQPNDIKVEVSNDDVSYTEVSNQVSVAQLVKQEWSQLFTVTSTACKYVKVTITRTGAKGTYVGFGELELNYKETLLPGKYSTITNHTTAVNVHNSNHGLQALAFKQNSLGLPTAVADANTIDFVNSNGYGNTQFKPNLDTYTIEEVVSGELQDFGGESVINSKLDVDISNWNSGFYTPILTHYNNSAIKMEKSQAYVSMSADLSETYNIGDRVLIEFDLIDTDLTSFTLNMSTTAVGLSADSTIVVENINITPLIGTRLSYEATIEKDNTSYLAFWKNLGTGIYLIVDNVSVKELTTKTQRTEHRVLTYDSASTNGKGLISNGDFSNGSVDWILQTSWTVHDGKADYDGVVYYAEIANTAMWEEGEEYILRFNLQGYGGDTPRVVIKTYNGAWNYSPDIYGNGDIEYHITATSNMNNHIWFVGKGARMYLDNVSLTSIHSESKYYINSVEQATAPALPDPNTIIKLDGKAVIGYPDDVDTERRDFKVYTEVKSSEEISNEFED